MSTVTARVAIPRDMLFTGSHPKPSRGSPDFSFSSKRFACKCLICTASPHTFLSFQTHTRCCVRGIASFGIGVISSSPTGERCCTRSRRTVYGLRTGRLRYYYEVVECGRRISFAVVVAFVRAKQRGTGVHHVFVCGGVRVYFRGCVSASKQCRLDALLLGKRRYRSWPART